MGDIFARCGHTHNDKNHHVKLLFKRQLSRNKLRQSNLRENKQ
jgi:hypothetical protein